MDQKIYYVVEVETSTFLFDSIKDASYFMRRAAEHIIIGRYQVCRPDVRMSAYTYEQLCNTFPNCKDIRRCLTATGSLHDPVLDDYMSADVRMTAYAYEQLCNTFPKNFKKEDDEMKLPLAQFLIRLKADELLNVIIDDRPNCKYIRRCVTATGSPHDPVLDDYMNADVRCVCVNDNGILEIEAVV